MKKVLVVLMAVMMTAMFASSSFAVDGTVQMTLTSPTIYKAGCEKIGSTTYTFQANSVITGGDWWYMDLPEKVVLCKDYNFMVVGNDLATPVVNIGTSPYNAAVFSGANILTRTGVANKGTGPASAGGTSPAITVDGGNMAFLVKGAKDSRRITIYAVTSTDLAAKTNATLTVGADSTFQIKLFDGKAHNQTTATTAYDSAIILDTDGDGIYGETISAAVQEVITGKAGLTATTGGEPYVENTLCSDNRQMSGQYLYTSYASKGDKFTFSGDSQIAHTATASTIELSSCKGATKDNIVLPTDQATCSFNYDAVGAVTAINNLDFCTSTFRNKMLIKATSGAFGDIDEKYTIDLEITSPSDGVYFGAQPSIVLYKSTEDACASANYNLPGVGGAIGFNAGAGWTQYEGSTVTTKALTTDDDCAVDSGQRVTKFAQTTGTAMDLDDYNQIWVDFGTFVYTSASVAAQEEVIVKATLNRLPCGMLKEFSLTLGSFVTACATSTSTTLYFPWLPGSDATGWWGGYVITNIGETAGKAKLTLANAAGKKATYETASVAAGAQWNKALTDADVTKVDSDFDMKSNYSVTAVCEFAARGFAFTGNGKEGTGYLAQQ